MRNKNKKGFTLVELVIVIAVIAILAAVLIPTFVTVIASANRSAALQEATNLRDQITFAYAEHEGFDAWCQKAIDIASDTSTTDGIAKVDSETNEVTIEIEKITVRLTKVSDDKEALPLNEIISNVDGKKITVKKETGDDKEDTYSIVYKVSGKYDVTVTASKKPDVE